eukprot:TRINITY_DN8269_c0_g2_i1.p1 TRINITY_DN8269_c0_g2~~TRINITY_DN8269_c0_g2_i1.p1  ORF type:complete len:957 (+),score=253.74 TRINITY_DN8269_c0_g2_i1:222-2873(+)
MFDSVRSLFTRMTDYTMEPPRGLLLYGPPGTGKTQTSDALGSGLGMTPVRDGGYAAGELQDGLQGGTEKKARTMLERAKACPWLMFCVVIDEVETLVPNRNDKTKSGGSGSSTLGILLTYFGGIQNVPNIFVFGATNMRGDIDPAFARRLSGKIFVGLPTSRSRAQWVPTLVAFDKEAGRDKKVPDGRFVFSDDVRRHLAALTTNMSGAQMNMVMTELQLALLEKCASDPCLVESYTVTHEAVSMAIQNVAERERILFGSSTVPALMVRGTASAGRSELEGMLEAGIEGNIANVLAHRMQEWTGRMFLNLSDLYEGSIDAFRGSYLDAERTGQRVWTFRQQHIRIPKDGDDSKTTVSPEFFKRMLLQLGVALDMNCVKLIDNSFFMKEGLEDEKDMVKAMNEEVLQCNEYARSLVILDLDAGFVDINHDSGMAHETIHRSTLFNSMLAMARDYAFCRPSEERFLFVVLMTSFSCITNRVEYTLRWPKNVLRQYMVDKRDAGDELRQCVRCKEWASASDSEKQAQCQLHDPQATLSREVLEPKPGDPSKQETRYVASSRSKVEQMQPAERAKWMWGCCGQPYFSNKCTAPSAARPHEFEEAPQPVRCTKRHDSLPALAAVVGTRIISTQFERVWCNACSVPVAETPAANAATACRICPGTAAVAGTSITRCFGSSSQEAPVWVHASDRCHQCALHKTFQDAQRALDSQQDPHTADLQRAFLWYRWHTSYRRWVRADLDHATWLHWRMTCYRNGEHNNGELGAWVKPIPVPWSPVYPESAKMFLDLRVFGKLACGNDHEIEFTTFNRTKADEIAAAIDAAQEASVEPVYDAPQPTLASETFKFVTPKFGPQPERCPAGLGCTDADVGHFASVLHPDPRSKRQGTA